MGETVQCSFRGAQTRRGGRKSHKTERANEIEGGSVGRESWGRGEGVRERNSEREGERLRERERDLE